jgi:hypothetical protein
LIRHRPGPQWLVFYAGDALLAGQYPGCRDKSDQQHQDNPIQAFLFHLSSCFIAPAAGCLCNGPSCRQACYYMKQCVCQIQFCWIVGILGNIGRFAISPQVQELKLPGYKICALGSDSPRADIAVI